MVFLFIAVFTYTSVYVYQCVCVCNQNAKSSYHRCSLELNNLMYFFFVCLLSFLLMRSFLRIIILYSLDNVKFNLKMTTGI